MLKPNSWSDQSDPTSPDYLGLVEFLVEPLLESPDALKVDCEQANNKQRVWIRLAFEATDKGRVFGRGGRNLQAIRNVLQTAATSVGQSLYLDIYDLQDDTSRDNYRTGYRPERKFVRKKPRTNNTPSPKLSIKSRWEE